MTDCDGVGDRLTHFVVRLPGSKPRTGFVERLNVFRESSVFGVLTRGGSSRRGCPVPASAPLGTGPRRLPPDQRGLAERGASPFVLSGLCGLHGHGSLQRGSDGFARRRLSPGRQRHVRRDAVVAVPPEADRRCRQVVLWCRDPPSRPRRPAVSTSAHRRRASRRPGRRRLRRSARPCRTR